MYYCNAMSSLLLLGHSSLKYQSMDLWVQITFYDIDGFSQNLTRNLIYARDLTKNLTNFGPLKKKLYNRTDNFKGKIPKSGPPLSFSDFF